MLSHRSASRSRSSLASSMMPSMANSSGPSQVELQALLLQHDPYAKRSLAYVPHVKVFHYRADDNHWDNNVHIEGCLVAYERHQPFNNELGSFYALAFINSKANMLQPIQLNMTEQANQLRLFYQVTLDEKAEVFCVFFDQERDCLRIQEFIQQAIKRMQVAAERHAQRIQTPIITRNSNSNEGPMHRTRGNQEPVAHRYPEPPSSVPPGFSQFVDSYGLSPSPVLSANNNHSPEDIELNLKRFLRIGDQHHFQEESVKLLPPAAFSPIPMQPHPSVETGNNGPFVQQSGVVVSREQFRRALIDLIRTDDYLIDAIHQACFNPRSLRQ